MATRSRIFMSYRRSDSLTTTGRLYDRLVNHLDAKYIFKDMENIPAGKDYRTVLEEELATCSVILIIIGNSWLSITDKEGKRRLDNPDDPVRLEVEMALARKDASVIPLLVDGASLPKAEELPESLRELHYRNAVTVRHDPDFRRDVEELIKKIESVSMIDEEILRGKMLRRGLVALIPLLLVIAALFIIRSSGVITDTPIPTTASTTIAPTLVPVADDEIMVAVAQFEPLKNASERNVARFIAADLKRNLEQNRITDKIRIREYSGVIHSSEEAQQVAEMNHAAIVIWGNYTPDAVTTTLEIGDLDQFKNIKIERSTIEAAANLQTRMTDEQSQSMAVNLLEMALVLQTSDSNLYEVLVNIVSSSFIGVTNAEILGNTVGANLHRAFSSYFSNFKATLGFIDAALQVDPTNRLALLFRSLTHFRRGEVDAALTDVRTTSRLSTDGWIAPAYLQFLYDFVLKDYQKAIDEAEPIIKAQPDQWYPYYIRSMQYFLMGEYDSASADLDKSLMLNPTTNFPYLLKIYLELRNGNMTHAKALYDESLRKFPDFTFGSKLIDVIGAQNLTEFKGTFDVFSNLLFERYDEAKAAATVLIDANVIMPEFYVGRAFAECSRDEFKEAVADLNLAEKLDSQNVLLYMLRAQSRLQLKDLIGATQDITKAQSLSTDPNFPYVVQLAISGKLTCQNYFDVVLPTAQPTASATP